MTTKSKSRSVPAMATVWRPGGMRRHGSRSVSRSSKSVRVAVRRIPMAVVVPKPRSLRDQVSPEEWAARVDLACAYRLVAHHGWTWMVYNHISARVPGHEHQFLLNPFGLHYT